MTSSGDNSQLPPSTTRKQVPAQAWSDHETSHLIAAYQDKWYSLKRGPLKANQWESVAVELAVKCGYGSRSGTQCRHKMEKLRKRYRAERKSPAPSKWIHFEQMDRMEQGPLPISIRHPVPSRDSAKDEICRDAEDDLSEDDDDGGEDAEESIRGSMRGTDGIHREVNWSYPRVSEDMEDRIGAAKKLASVVRRFGEGLSRIEKRKMDLMRELERDWMEMEAKREAMWIASERYLVETISRAFRSEKKAKKTTEM